MLFPPIHCFVPFEYLSYAKLIVFMFSGMAWKRTSLTNSLSTTQRADCEFKKKKLPALNLVYLSDVKLTLCVICVCMETLWTTRTTPRAVGESKKKCHIRNFVDLRDACKDTNTFSLCVCVQEVSPSRQCNYALSSNPLFCSL
jgi:hypothetical protein